MFFNLQTLSKIVSETGNNSRESGENDHKGNGAHN